MQSPPLHDPVRDLWVVPIRHHSPACAAQLERLIAAVNPAAIVVEGPCDFDPLIPLLCDPRTRAPVAVVALREAARDGATRRVASYFPFCAHSPELIALQAAASRGIPARFIDLPATARAMVDEDDAAQGRSLLGDERPFDVGDYVTALARELGCRDGNEVWDQVFETRLTDADWRGFFADVGQYCACIRAATDVVRIARDGTLVRETQMRALVAEVRAQVAGPIIVVVGGFHATALLAQGSGSAVKPEDTAGRCYLIRYGMRQLDAMAGYGAGLPMPGFYDRLWHARDSGGRALAVEIVTGFARHLRQSGGDAPSFPVVTGAIEQAERLAALRGRPFPARDDILDAIRSTFIKEEVVGDDAPLLVALRTWLTGAAIGEVPPGSGAPPLVDAVRARARALGFTVADGERRNRTLDIYRKDRHRAASRFCHAMVLIGADFAQRTAGPDFRNDAMLDRLFEIWDVCWSPLVEARLIELSEAADTLDEALAFALAHKLAALEAQGKGRSALAAIDLFAAACRAGLGKGGEAILQLVEAHVVEDPELHSVVSALADLVQVWRGRDILGITDTTVLDSLMATAWRRILVLLPELADCATEQVRAGLTALADLRGVIALARSCAAPLDLALFDEALARLAAADLDPLLAGGVLAFALIDGQGSPQALQGRLRGELASGHVDPAERLALLGGVIAVARELLWSLPEIIATLNDVIAGADEAQFVDLLPHLRLALMPLDPREVDRLGEDVAAMIGARPDHVSMLIAIPQAEMMANLALDRELAAVLDRDGVA